MKPFPSGGIAENNRKMSVVLELIAERVSLEAMKSL